MELSTNDDNVVAAWVDNMGDSIAGARFVTDNVIEMIIRSYVVSVEDLCQWHYYNVIDGSYHTIDRQQ